MSSGNERPAPREPGSELQSLERTRERVIDALGLHFANDDLSMTELERRLTLAFQARSPEALDVLLADLPPISGARVREREQSAGRSDVPVLERGFLAAVMGGNVRKGPWNVPRQLKIFAIMGGAELDFRQARFAPGVTQIEVLCVMGGVELILPPGVRVEMMGIAIMGGFDTNAGEEQYADPDQPVLRISGLVMMGGVEAKQRIPSTRAMRKFRRALRDALTKSRDSL